MTAAPLEIPGLWSLLERSSVGVAITGLDGGFRHANPAYCRMLGYSEAALQALDVRAPTHPEDWPRYAELLAELLDGRRDAFVIETRYRHRDGHDVWARVSVAIVREGGANSGAVIALTEDISAQRLAEQRAEDQAQLLSRATNDAIWDWDMVTGQLWWGDGFESLFGFAAADEAPTLDGWARRIHPEDAAEVTRSLTRAVEGTDDTWSHPYRFLRADGSYAEVLDRGQILRDASGTAVRMVGGMSDLSELLAARREVLEQTTLLDQANDAISVRDLELRVLRWNRGAEDLYGVTGEAIIGRPITEVVPELAVTLGDALAAVMEAGEWSGEFVLAPGTPRQRSVLARWSLLRDVEGAPHALLAIETDTSAHKAVESQLLRAQRLESIGTLAGGIAHDLNNVLAPILMSIELLRLDAPDDLARETLATIERSAQRGTDMVRQLLTFARGVDGRRVEVDVGQLLTELERIIRETFPKHLELRCTRPAALPAVLGDPTQVHQVLLNLCVNARDAMPDGGSLRLSARVDRLDEHFTGLAGSGQPGLYVILEVSDTGVGMSPETMERMFEPFFTTKPVGRGTGLGLSTSQAIVRNHGGFVRVTSTLGRGTTFEVYLPALEGVVERMPDTVDALPRGAGECLLVVDDEGPVREITRKTLEAFGYRVLTAGEGSEAIAVLASRRDEVAMVITDMMMPGMDGAATIPVLRHMAPTMPILAVSGVGGSGPLARARSLGATTTLAKPFTASALLQAVHAALTAARVDPGDTA